MVYFRWVGVRESDAWSMVILPKKKRSCSLLQKWLYYYYLNVQAQYQSAGFRPLILKPVTEYITWGPPDTSTLDWWNETGAELHLQACAWPCRTPERLHEAKGT